MTPTTITRIETAAVQGNYEITEAHMRALVNHEIRAIEVALTGEDPWALLERSCRWLGDDALVGVGTVLSVADARRAVDAGARFLASPVVTEGLESVQVPTFPGVQTPADVHAAMTRGFSRLKLFPARLGPGYLSDLRGPFPDVELYPSGGVDASSLPRWCEAGAAGVFMGSSLIRSGGGVRPPEEIAEVAASVASAWKGAEGGCECRVR